MASIWLPSAGDQENMIRLPGATKGKAFNKLAPRGSGYGKKMSATPKKGLVYPAQQQGPAGRTFGDISNLLADRGAAITPARGGKPVNNDFSSIKKPAGLKPQQPAPVVGLITKPAAALVKPADTERDFFPIIIETEDYSDELPTSLLLGREDIQRLVQEWRVLQRPSHPQSPLRSPSPPPSPSHLLLDDCCDLPQQILLQPCGLEAAAEFSELQVMPVDW